MNKLKLPERKAPRGKTADDVANEVQKAIDAGKRSITVKGPFTVDGDDIYQALRAKRFNLKHTLEGCTCTHADLWDSPVNRCHCTIIDVIKVSW